MLKNKFLVLSLAVAFIAASFLSFESYLRIAGKSLCSTSACSIVGKFLLVDEIIVTAIGAAFFWVIFASFIFSDRYPRFLGYLPSILLFTALPIDGSLLGFQFFSIQQKCLICITVATAFLSISILYFISKKSYYPLALVAILWFVPFFTQSIFKTSALIPDLNQITFYSKSFGAESKKTLPKYTFIFSMQCAHCNEIIKTLSKKTFSPSSWYFSSIDEDDDSLQKLTKFENEADNWENPFALLEKIKQVPQINFNISNEIKKKGEATKSFLHSLQIAAIPVLVIDDLKGNICYHIGSPNILNALKNEQSISFGE